MNSIDLPTRVNTLASPTSSQRNAASSAAEIKIAYLGGGSRQWAVHLMKDLALSDRLAGKLVLFDIDHPAAEHNARLGQEIFAGPIAAKRFEVEAESSLSKALQGADFVVISIEPGPTELRHSDLEIPAKYGILQTVGDTTGPGGVLRALRCVPTYRIFAQEIMEYCPKAWVINYTNPMAVCTGALYREAPAIRAIGCCHEVFSTQKYLAKKVGTWFGVETPPREEIELDISGVNHFTFATGARWKGRDLAPCMQELISDETFFADRTADAIADKHRNAWFGDRNLIGFDLLRRFGALGAAGDRHLAEFVPWYLTSEAELHRWGVVLTPYWWRLERSTAPRPQSFSDKTLTPSGEEGVLQIEALLGLRPLNTNVNMPNRGQAPDLPEGAIVETYAEFRTQNIRPMLADRLPEGAAMWVKRAVSEQELTMRAAFEGDFDIALQAILSHPLVRISTDASAKMLKEMIDASIAFMPGWKKR